MSEPEVPEQVYQDAALAQQAAWGAWKDAEFEQRIAERMAAEPPFRAAVESAYRAGYGQGRDDEAAGVDVAQPVYSPKLGPHPEDR